MITVKYDVIIPFVTHSHNKYLEEKSHLIDFDKSSHNNMCLEYESVRQARIVAATLLRHTKKLNLNVRVVQRLTLVYRVHKEVK
jgi:hypothetical protein